MTHEQAKAFVDSLSDAEVYALNAWFNTKDAGGDETECMIAAGAAYNAAAKQAKEANG